MKLKNLIAGLVAASLVAGNALAADAVSYTHLDVYKRQMPFFA